MNLVLQQAMYRQNPDFVPWEHRSLVASSNLGFRLLVYFNRSLPKALRTALIKEHKSICKAHSAAWICMHVAWKEADVLRFDASFSGYNNGTVTIRRVCSFRLVEGVLPN